jgi:tetratricopeptide (TPR) repeat protein
MRSGFMLLDRRSVCLLLVLLVAPYATVRPQAQDGPPAAGSGVARFDVFRAQGAAALLNLDYDLARQRFREMGRLYPDDPLAPEMLAMTLWLEALHRARLLQAAIYSTQGFYSASEDRPDPQLVKEFRDLTRQATQLANARLKRNPGDPQTLYVLGATQSLQASFAATVERRFMAALRLGSSAIDTNREILKLDPQFHDAELSIGLYDYIVGSLPLPVRVLASIAGAGGSKKRGIQTLAEVAREGQWTRDDAKVLLIAIYKKEGRFPEALALSEEMQERYPGNYLFRLETADTLVSQAANERQASRPKEAEALESEALRLFATLLRERSSGTTPRALDLIHFRLGEALLVMGQPERAAREFLAGTAVKGAEAGVVSRSHLRAAQAFDIAGKRKEAVAEYEIVLRLPNIFDSHKDARRGEKEPYRLPPKVSR